MTDQETNTGPVSAVPLGYLSAKAALRAGRAAFFGHADSDLPANRSPLLTADDRTPQFGYVGTKYAKTHVLLLGINPGNGSQTEVRSATDARMMPALVQFAQTPTPENFTRAQEAYKAECQTWHIWKRHCSEIIGAGKLTLEDVAYSNCLPWRSRSESAFDEAVAERAARLYAYPLIEELRPTVVVALGRKSSAILQLTGQRLPRVIVWNRAQAATPTVLRDRADAAREIFRLLADRQ